MANKRAFFKYQTVMSRVTTQQINPKKNYTPLSKLSFYES